MGIDFFLGIFDIYIFMYENEKYGDDDVAFIALYLYRWLT